MADLSKITKHAGLIGGLLAAVDADGLSAIRGSVENAMVGHVHSPNLKDTLNQTLNIGNIKGLVGASVVAWAADALIGDQVPHLGTVANFLKRMTVTYGGTRFLMSLLYNSTHSGDMGGAGENGMPIANLLGVNKNAVYGKSEAVFGVG